MLIEFGKRVPRDRSWIYKWDFKSSLKEVSWLKTVKTHKICRWLAITGLCLIWIQTSRDAEEYRYRKNITRGTISIATQNDNKKYTIYS